MSGVAEEGEINMEAELQTNLPQEGTGLTTGESLSESNSGCPIVSGGGIISPTFEKQTKKFVQQAFHPSLFVRRPRSASMTSLPNDSTPRTNLNAMEIESSDKVNPQSQTSANPPSWQRVPSIRNPKRKKVSESRSPSPDRIEITNRFSGLTVDLTEEAEQPLQIKKPNKPPPIILYGIEDLNKLTELIEISADKSQFTYKNINKNQLKITTANIEIYKNVISTIREKGLIGHTFNRKDKRPYRIVIRNLHHTTPLSSIKEAIEETGNTIDGEIINARYGPDKKPTSTFFVNVSPGPNNKAVKDIKVIYHQIVNIEDPRKRNTVVQCQRCQQYGHTKNYCMKPYRCVKCAEAHKTSECPKVDRNTPATCALCLGSHPANYKGCEVYKEILARKTAKRLPLRSLKSTNQALHIAEGNTALAPKPENAMKKSYSQASKHGLDSQSAQPNVDLQPNSLKLIEQIFSKQSEKIDLVLQQMSTLLQLITSLISKLG